MSAYVYVAVTNGPVAHRGMHGPFEDMGRVIIERGYGGDIVGILIPHAEGVTVDGELVAGELPESRNVDET